MRILAGIIVVWTKTTLVYTTRDPCFFFQTGLENLFIFKLDLIPSAQIALQVIQRFDQLELIDSVIGPSYFRALIQFGKEITEVAKEYKRHKEDPPVPWDVPPVAGMEEFRIVFFSIPQFCSYSRSSHWFTSGRSFRKPELNHWSYTYHTDAQTQFNCASRRLHLALSSCSFGLRNVRLHCFHELAQGQLRTVTWGEAN